MEMNEERTLAYKKAHQIEMDDLGKVVGGTTSGTTKFTTKSTTTPYQDDVEWDLPSD